MMLPRWSRGSSGLGPRDVVVLTDRYPPDAHGGAEVSLHIFLKALAMGRSLLVVTLGDRALAPSRYEIDGVEVLVLPRGGRAPMHALPHALTLAPARLPARMRAAAIGSLKRGAALLPSRADERDLQMLRDLEAARPRGGVVADAVEFTDAYPVPLLRDVLRETRPRVLHADNYRSVMLAAEASAGLSTSRVGVVRDNRFTCTRHDQSRTVSGRRCGTCDFACAAVDLKNDPALQERALRRALEGRRDALGQMDRVVVTSEYLRESLQGVVADDRMITIANAPDDEGLVRDATLGVAELPGTNILVVGMLNENKGQLELVKALRALVTRVPDAVLHFAGRGDRIAESMRAEARRQGLEDRLVLHGYVGREDLYTLYAECQIVALPTIWPEPFGRVPLEAAVVGRPVVSFAVGGLRESILDGQTGVLVPPGDMTRFVAEIAALASSTTKRREMGERARRHVLATYSVDAMKLQLAALWRELLGVEVSA